MKHIAGRVIRAVLPRLGLDLKRDNPPVIKGAQTITGSFASFSDVQRIGARENYFIKDGYVHRTEPKYFDDTSNADDWQNEVYQFALEIAQSNGVRRVADVGCGSGFKLLKYFHNYETVGMDVPATVDVLKRRYPEKAWEVCDFGANNPPSFDMVICSDVIEHVPDPDQLLGFIQKLKPKFLVLSTPDRNLFRLGTHNGPPYNSTHLREWTMFELNAYISEFFQVKEHFLSNAAQATQCLLAVPKNAVN